ncbi:excinuclease ABC subunit UvrB [Patescibacteria group bacterium]|nr:excinuclease ABC subunit UvrB [Patescibacteria group bacterium]MBU4512729.1 excinuclease ABC subunit UvrB [Patescibacteria group bacterium]MCG2693398.1 excinuclease ABC subunit UvrB [Candidatus Parcubacteria bacterium]
MKFKLQSKFKPTGDQPQAIKKLTQGLQKGYRDQTLLGVTGSGKTFTMANVIQNIQKPTLVISHNKTLAAQLASEFQEFFPENAVHYFVSYYDYYQPEAYIPRSDTYIAKDSSINEEIDRLRHAATQSLLTRSDVIVVASVSCIYGLGSPEHYEGISLSLRQGQKIKRDDVLRELTEMYYKRNDIGFNRGTFRVRGDVLDIYPSNAIGEYVRLELFGDRIDRIKYLDELTLKETKKLVTSNKKQGTTVTVFPASHFVTYKDEFKKIAQEIQEELKDRIKYFKKNNKLLEAQRIEQRTKFDLEMMKETGYCAGIENYSRYLDGRQPGQPPFVLLDYFIHAHDDFLIFIDESHMTVPQIGGMHAGDRARKTVLIDYGFRLPSALDNRPLNFSEFDKRIKQVIYVSATPREYEITQSKQTVEQLIRPTGLIDPTIEVKPIKNQIDDLMEQIRQRVAKKQRVLVTTLTKRLAEDLSEYLREAGIKVQYLHSEIGTFERLDILRDLRLGKYDVVVGINLLREGLDLPEVSLIVILDADKEGFLRNDISLIQTMGRAARHQDGHVIMYADRMTGSMKTAMQETNRRRRTQEKYNQKHGIVPATIQKEIKKERFAPERALPLDSLRSLEISASPRELVELIKDLEDQMELAAKNLEFERAAVIRDEIGVLKKVIK